GEGSTRAFGHSRVQAGEAAQVEFVNDERLGRDALPAWLARRRRARNRLRRVRTAIFAEGEHRGMEAERTVERVGVGVRKQLRCVEAMSAPRAIGIREISRSWSNRQSETPSAFGRSSAASRPRGEATTPRLAAALLMRRFARWREKARRSVLPGLARIRPPASR